MSIRKCGWGPAQTEVRISESCSGGARTVYGGWVVVAQPKLATPGGAKKCVLLRLEMRSGECLVGITTISNNFQLRLETSVLRGDGGSDGTRSLVLEGIAVD